MTTLAMYAPEGRIVDLAKLSPADYSLIGNLHGQIKRGNRILVCLQGGVDNGEMYIRHVRGQYWAAHFPGDSHGQHAIAVESDEHRRQKDYWYRAAEDSGYRSSREMRTGNGTILDVAIYGHRNVGIEVQRSPITLSSIKGRTTKSHRAGWLSVWFTDAETAPKWMHRVPSLGCNRLPWDVLPPRRAATATGLRTIEAVRCTPGAFGRCPDGYNRPCGKYHPLLTPLGGLTVDDVAAMVPSGSLVPLVGRNDYVYLVTPSSAALYRELTSLSGAFEPGALARVQIGHVVANSKECFNPTHNGSSAMSASNVETAPSSAFEFVRAHAAEYRRCARIVGCPVPYPDGNQCTRCERVSSRPLVPHGTGWHCKTCAYPTEPEDQP